MDSILGRKDPFLDKILILKLLLGLRVFFSIKISNKVHIVVKMRHFSSLSDEKFESHGFHALLTLVLEKMLILGISVGFRGIVYNRD